MKSKAQIVILGAGYAGMTAAIHLENKLSKKNFQVTLVDGNSYHELIQESHLVAAGFRKPEHVRIPISDLIKGTEIKFIQSSVKKIKTSENKVILANSNDLYYDYLVVALGSSTRYFGIENAMKYGLTIQSIDEALTVHSKIMGLIKNNQEKNDSDNGNNTSTVVIVGGGPTGVGIAGVLADLMNHHFRNHQSIAKIPELNLVTASSTVLPGFDQRIIDKVTQILKRKGVTIMTNGTVSAVKQHSITLKTGDRTSHIPSSLTIWTPGIEGYDLSFEPQIKKAKNKRIIVNEFCQIDSYPNIFCIGDIAAIADNSGAIRNPPLGHIAISQAIYIAESIPEYLIYGKKPSEKFNPDVKIRILSLGLEDYVGFLNNIVVTGDIAKVIKEFKREAHLESVTSGEVSIAAKIYKNDPISNLLSSIFLAGFSISQSLKDMVSPLHTDNENKSIHTNT
jgi:NADH:ubiquinone reductase (H+-translocating)